MTARLRTVAARLGFAALLVAATSPAWLLLRPGHEPTDDELRQLGCRTRPAAARVDHAGPDDARRSR